ncbi:MAG: tetratricopeptide repeat protein [Armatimonadetes bacterium]|nr:tetratricopeptide repeat protein [Armatimonadota bacterium]
MDAHVGSRWVAVVAVSGLAIGVLAAQDPGEAVATTAGYQEAMAAGTRALGRLPGTSGHDRPKIDFAAARQEFRKALALARTDGEKAAALLAVADSRLNDCQETDYPTIREDFARVLALPGAGPGECARAALGIGETYLREKEYDRARAEFARAKETGADPGVATQAQYALAYSYLQQRRAEDARREFTRLLETGRLRAPLEWRVRALLRGIERVPQVRRGHPRLFFNAETWPAVKARALGIRKAELDQMKERVDGIALADLEGKDRGSQAMEAAFVYRVTGDPAALAKTRKLMRVSMDFHLGRTVTRGRMYSLVGLAAALDWLWDDVPRGERDALAQDMVGYVHTMDVEDQVQGKGILSARSYYIMSIPWYFGLAVLDDDLDDVTYARVFTALSRGFLQYDGFLADASEKGGDDGAIRTALEYYFAETMTTLWQFLYCWQSALNAPIPSQMAYFLSPDYVLRNALGFTPRLLHFGYGNSWRSRTGMRADLLYDHLAHMLHFYGESHPDQMGIARTLRERMERAGVTGEGQYSIYPFLRDLAKAPPAVIPPDLPIARHFEYVGQILMSSGFGPKDTHALFSCGGNQEYGQLDATHFTLYKQGHLALDSGTRAQDHAGAPGANYNRQTVAHNCVLIYMDGEEPLWNAVNSGGQRRNPSDARLIAFESRRAYAYAATDATPVYYEDKCAQMVRQFLFLPPDHFVVFDRVAAKKAEYPKTWLLHTANEPAITGKEFRADQDEGRLFCRTLYPPDAVLEKIGGPGKEFWAGGRNWPIPADSPYLRGYLGTDSADNIPESIGRWRVEVKPGAAREDDCFLHLIQVSDRGVEKMVESRVSEQGTRIELAFTANGRTCAIALNKAGSVGGHIRITEERRVLVDRPLAQKIMSQSGLALAP